MTKINKMNDIITILILSFVTLTGVGCLTKMIPIKKLYHDTILVEDVLISDEQKEFEIENSVKIERDRQFIRINLDSAYENDYDIGGIRTPSGEVVNPEIKIIDNDGNEYSLIYFGSTGDKTINYAYEGKLPANKVFKKLLLKSNLPIKTKQILWSSYYFKDLK